MKPEKKGNTEGRLLRENIKNIMNSRIHLLTNEERAYIAGFLEGDGSIFSQIVRRDDYRLKFQIKSTVSFTQKSSRLWFLQYLQSKLGVGTIRDKKNGCHDLTITGNNEVKLILEALTGYLIVKKKLANLVLRIIDSLSKKQSPDSFLESCLLVDKIATFTDSKKRTVTSETVRDLFQFSLIVPVETSIKAFYLIGMPLSV